MPIRSPAKKARSPAARFAILAGIGAVTWHTVARSGAGPAYAVKGDWEGEPSALKDAVKGEFGEVIEGLGPKVAQFPPVGFEKGGLSVGVGGGGAGLSLGYTTQLDGDTTLRVKGNEAKAWDARLDGKDMALRIRGQGDDVEKLAWDAMQKGTVDLLGDVKLEFNSDKEYNLTVARDGMSVAGVDIGAKARATQEGIEGSLGARKQLGPLEVSYNVANQMGNYDVASARHAVRLQAPLAGGRASLLAAGDVSSLGVEGAYAAPLAGGVANVSLSQKDGARGYNVSYSRSLTDVAPPRAVDAADAAIGIDENGAYARFDASRPLGKSARAQYSASMRSGLGEDAERHAKHAVRVSNKLGWAELAHGTGHGPRLRLGYEFEA